MNTGAVDSGGPGAEATEKWFFDTDHSVVSSPAVTDSTVYVSTFSGSFWGMATDHREGGLEYARNQSGYIYALDRDTGEVEWSKETTGSAWASPTFDDGVVYAATMAGVVYAVDADSGDTIWRFKADHPVYTSPTFYEGTLYLGTRDYDGHELSHRDYPFYALDASDGEVEWRVDVEEGVFATAGVADGVVYVGGQNGTLHALDAGSGDEIWGFETRGQRHQDDPLMRVGGVTSPPTIRGDTVYFGSYAGDVYAVEASTGDEIWSYPTYTPIASSPTVYDGVVYIGSYDGGLYALDAEEGGQLWAFVAEERISKSSPAVADDVVYVGSVDDNLYAIDASDGSEHWSYYTDEWVLSSPAVYGDYLYFTSLAGVHAVEPSEDGVDLPTKKDFEEVENDTDVAYETSPGEAVSTGSEDEPEEPEPSDDLPVPRFVLLLLGVSLLVLGSLWGYHLSGSLRDGGKDG